MRKPIDEAQDFLPFLCITATPEHGAGHDVRSVFAQDRQFASGKHSCAPAAVCGLASMAPEDHAIPAEFWQSTPR
jgi:hypothetical protein